MANCRSSSFGKAMLLRFAVKLLVFGVGHGSDHPGVEAQIHLQFLGK